MPLHAHTRHTHTFFECPSEWTDLLSRWELKAQATLSLKSAGPALSLGTSGAGKGSRRGLLAGSVVCERLGPQPCASPDYMRSLRPRGPSQSSGGIVVPGSQALVGLTAIIPRMLLEQGEKAKCWLSLSHPATSG